MYYDDQAHEARYAGGHPDGTLWEFRLRQIGETDCYWQAEDTAGHQQIREQRIKRVKKLAKLLVCQRLFVPLQMLTQS